MQLQFKIFLIAVAVTAITTILGIITVTDNIAWPHMHLLHSPLKTQPRFTENWQTIINGSDDLYGFRAYFDDMGKQSYVRLIGLAAISIPHVYCDLQYANGNVTMVDGHVFKIPYSRGWRYTNIILLCPLPTEARPYAVSIAVNKSQKASAVFPVHSYINTTRKFTMCVSAIHGYKNVYEMVEMVEANRLLGAEYFMFYYQSSSQSITHILNHYAKEGIVEVVQWHLPQNVSSRVHYLAQQSQLNDCMYRNLRRSKYIISTDMDELIMPRLHDTWSQMLDNLPNSAAYFFRCVIFRKDWPDIQGNSTEKRQALKYNVQSVLKQRREKRIFKPFQRSKHIIMPSLVEVVGIHAVHKFRERRYTVVDPAIASLHHYRNLNNYTDIQSGINDIRIVYFQKKLLASIEHRWQILNGSLTADRS